jgi:cyclase
MGLFALVAPSPSQAQMVETEDHIITTVAEGVYTIRHKNAVRLGAISGSTTVIIGERDVLIIDSGSLPSIANVDIALIRKWTSKPVRYVVNTHWHGDHTWGNSAYMDAFPGVTIIAHSATPPLMQGYLLNFIPRNVAYPEQARRMLATGKEADGRPLSKERREEVSADLPNAEVRATEYRTLVTRLPNLTFDHALDLDLGNRLVQIRYLGRGNTSGDAVVILPKEKIVATGDLLVYPQQFFIGGFPSEWSKTLQRVSELGAQTIIPGHGMVLAGDTGKDYLNLIKDWLDVVSLAVRREVFRLGNIPPNDTEDTRRDFLIAVRKAVTNGREVVAFRQRYAGDDADRRAFFDSALPNIIDSAYREAWGN